VPAWSIDDAGPEAYPDRSGRRELRYELLGCALHGHRLVGTDAATVRPEDHLVAREEGGLRWYRCLRCDAWIPRPAPVAPSRDHPPERAEIAIPLRGRPLRDRFVLRLIAVDRALHVLILGSLAGVLFAYAADRRALEPTLNRVLADFQGGLGGPGVHRATGLLGELDKLLTIKEGTLWKAGAVVAAYAVLEAVEMVGLWRTRRWAEYLTFVATTLLLPIEVYELVGRLSVLKVLALVVNLAVVVYLLVAKRLFGLRGGGRKEAATKAADMSWETLERLTPVPPSPAELRSAGP
jgi:uncharacterized membrane protein (DUF2068 family)